MKRLEDTSYTSREEKKFKGYRLSGLINGWITIIFLVACLILSIVSIPSQVALELIKDFLIICFICGSIGLSHFLKYSEWKGKNS